jgi:cupin superfamily acireductone dioxygenase involved in methionine salvage
MITVNRGENISESVGVSTKRYAELKNQANLKVTNMISDSIKNFIENPSKEKSFSSYDVLKCCEGIAKTEAETFMMGIIFSKIVDNVNELHKKMQE